MFQNIILGRRTLLLLACVFPAVALAQSNDLSGATDDSIRNVLRVVADRQLRTTATGTTPRILTDGNYATVYTLAAATSATKPGNIQWDYPWGVNLYGLTRAYLATGNTNYLNFVLTHNLIVGRYYVWLNGLKTTVTNATAAQLASFYATTSMKEFFLNDNPSSGKLDYCGSMTSQLLEGALNYGGGPSAEQIKVCTNTANYISNVQARYLGETLYRPERSYTIWADDLYMSCPFLIRWYRQTGDTNFLNDAVKQVRTMAGYLQDTNGIWFHGYYTTNSKPNGIKWGRANGWAMVTQAELLSVMPTNHPNWTNVLDIFRRHIEGIKSVQQSSGLWRQILDYNSSTNWEETSCSAMYAYCIARAVNRGWIDATNMTVARNAFVGVCRNITTNGVVNGTGAGTSLDTRISYYLGLSRPSDDMHGRGAMMLAGAEILLTNRPPMAPDQAAIVLQNRTAVLATSNLLAAASDPDGDQLVIASADAASTNGGSVALDASVITYMPASNFIGADLFHYVVSDNRGGSATGAVNLSVVSSNAILVSVVSPPAVSSSGGVHIGFAGLPGYRYAVQYAPVVTGLWSTLTNLTAPPDGRFEFEDPTDLLPGFGFYRVVCP